MSKETDQAAKELGIRIIAMDRPGFGLSEFQKNRTLLDWPEDVVELADQLGIKKFAVMGVSGGGPYAAACAYRIPERLTKVGIVVGLAPTYIKGILKGMAKTNEWSWANYHRVLGMKTTAAWLRYFTSVHLSFLNSKGFQSKADKQLIDGDFKKSMDESFKETFKQGIKGPAWDLKLYTEYWGFNLKDIRAKVYLWYGEDDKNVSLAMGKYYEEQIPDAKLTVYPGEGHFCRVNHEEEILRALI